MSDFSNRIPLRNPITFSTMKNVATRTSWKNLPLPNERAKLNLSRAFSNDEYNQLKIGHIPQDMDDKWFIFFENDILYFHRSWTGICTYEVHLEKSHAIQEAWANRNRTQYKGSSNKDDEHLLIFLIDNFLLGRSTPFPLPKDIPTHLPKGLYQHSVSGTNLPEIKIEEGESSQ